MTASTRNAAIPGLPLDDAAMLAALPADLRAVHGVPDDATASDRSQAAALVSDVLADCIRPSGVRTSVLGPGFSTDIDVHLHTWPQAQRLLDQGWLPLDPLLRRLGRAGNGRWAVVQGDRVLAALDLTDAPLPDQLEAVLGRCRRRGEVRLREALELRALRRRGVLLPDDPVVDAAAVLERQLGAAFENGPPAADARGGAGAVPLPLPLAMGPLTRVRSWAGRHRETVRPRLVVALSGVDGAGKSTLAKGLVDQLRRGGVPAGIVWSRPGLGLGGLRRLAVLAKRSLGQNVRPGIEVVAGGNGDLASRRGLIGWAWSTVVTLSFLLDVHRQRRRVSGVTVFDRHVLDALVTLDFAYSGSDLRLQRALVRRLLPKADLELYLDVPAALAVSRKPGDMIGDFAVRSQLDLYRRRRSSRPRLQVLDATRPSADVVAEALDRLLSEDALGRGRRRRGG